MSDLEFDLHPLEGAEQSFILHLEGRIDSKTVPSFQEKVDEIKEKGMSNFVLDMGGVDYINSTGLGTLVKLHDRIREEGGNIALANINQGVRVPMESLGVDTFFDTHDTPDKAIESLIGEEGNGSSGTENGDADDREDPPDATSNQPTDSGTDGEESSASTDLKEESTGVAVDEEEEEIIEPVSPDEVDDLFDEMRTGREEPDGEGDAIEVKFAGGDTRRIRREKLAEEGLYECETCEALLDFDRSSPGEFLCPRCSTVIEFAAGDEPRFITRDEGPPISLTVNCRPESTEGLLAMIETIARERAFDEKAIDTLEKALRASADLIRTRAYGDYENCTYRVLIVTESDRLRLQFSDHGKAFGEEADELTELSDDLERLEIEEDPEGGNRITFDVRS